MTTNIPQAFTLAVQHHQAGRLAEAEAVYRQILAVEPNHAGARHFLGVIAHQMGHHEVAIECIRQAIALDPNDAAAYSNLGVAYRMSGRPQEAISSYRQAIQLKPDYAAAYNNLGIVLAAQRQFDEAIAAYRQAIVLQPDYPEAYNNLGGALANEGQFDEAIAVHRRALELKPDYPEALNDLGNALYHQSRLEDAVAAYRGALALDSNYAKAHNNLGNVFWKLGQLDEAIAAYRQALTLQSSYAEAHNNLGGVLQEKDDLDEALLEFRRALEINPDLPEAHNNLGNALHKQGRREEAVATYRRALELRPDLAEVHSNLANTLIDQGHHAEAIAACHRALAIKPDYPGACVNLGNALKGLGRFNEAVAAYRQALTFKPDCVDAWVNLGIEHAKMARLDEAITAYRRALEIQPDHAEAHNNLGNVLKDRGELDEAIQTYRHLLQCEPKCDGAHSNLIYALHFHPSLEEEAIAEEQRRWNRQFGKPLATSILPHTNNRDPERRLRIGYVSPDFRFHAVTFFFAPLLEAHDHEQFEIYCYASVSWPDSLTARLRQGADVWREVRYLTDAELAESIRQDGIDILVDLTLHSSGNRLLAFARQPAPVQVSWLGYPGSAGLEAIGHRLSDACIDPFEPGEPASNEQVVRLPDAWCCYQPIAEFPAVGALPAANGRGVTFGSLNQFAKTNEALLSCWTRLLRTLPDARLLMICPAGQAQEYTRRQFAEHGVAPERLELVAPLPWADYIQLCERADVSLDTYPCNGMTTTCHALWMGLPVITRAGASAVSRASLSLLHALGLPELVAHSEEEYVRIAVELAGDLKRLAELRTTLRARMAASPLMDAPRFARNMEAAYRTMWQHWCQEKPAR